MLKYENKKQNTIQKCRDHMYNTGVREMAFKQAEDSEAIKLKNHCICL